MNDDLLKQAIEVQRNVNANADTMSIADLRSYRDELRSTLDESKRYREQYPEWKQISFDTATTLMTVEGIIRRRTSALGKASPKTKRKPRSASYAQFERRAVEIARRLVEDDDPAFTHPIVLRRAARRVIGVMQDEGLETGSLTPESVITYLRSAGLLPDRKL